MRTNGSRDRIGALRGPSSGHAARSSGALLVLAAAAAMAVAACTSGSAAGAGGGGASPAATVAAAAPASTADSLGGGYDSYSRVAPSDAPAASAAAAGAAVYEVGTATDAATGPYLTGENGMTLYIFKKDSAGKSVCNGQCAANWPPFTLTAAETVKAGAGVGGALATITRDDGSTQVTYNGTPVYYYAADKKAGDVVGQGVGGVWFVAAP